MITRRTLRKFLSAILISACAVSLTILLPTDAVAQKRSTRSRTQKPQARRQAKTDYTSFSHTTHAVTQKLACSSCHTVPSKNWKLVRAGDAAFADVTDFPEHSSCLSCHRTQFFARERPAPSICSNCHIAVTPRDTARWLFPSLGDLTDPKFKRREFTSEFGVAFPHDKHIEVVGMNSRRPTFINTSLPDKPDWSATVPVANSRARTVASGTLALQSLPKSCPVCHQVYQPQGKSNDEYLTKPPKAIGDAFWLKKGTFQTIPNSHTVCFSCHNADSGIPPDSKNCETCHKLTTPLQLKADFDAKLAPQMGADKTMIDRWSRRISAGGFRHEGGIHPDVSCLNCHAAASATFVTVDPKSMRVPVKSCGGAEGCHITPTTDDGGALNFEIDSRKKDPKFVCTKCHVMFGNEPIPASHAQAIPTPKPKTN